MWKTRRFAMGATFLASVAIGYLTTVSLYALRMPETPVSTLPDEARGAYRSSIYVSGDPDSWKGEPNGPSIDSISGRACLDLSRYTALSDKFSEDHLGTDNNPAPRVIRDSDGNGDGGHNFWGRDDGALGTGDRADIVESDADLHSNDPSNEWFYWEHIGMRGASTEGEMTLHTKDDADIFREHDLMLFDYITFQCPLLEEARVSVSARLDASYTLQLKDIDAAHDNDNGEEKELEEKLCFFAQSFDGSLIGANVGIEYVNPSGSQTTTEISASLSGNVGVTSTTDPTTGRTGSTIGAGVTGTIGWGTSTTNTWNTKSYYNESANLPFVSISKHYGIDCNEYGMLFLYTNLIASNKAFDKNSDSYGSRISTFWDVDNEFTEIEVACAPCGTYDINDSPTTEPVEEDPEDPEDPEGGE